MKKKDIVELRNKAAAELKKLVIDKKKELFKSTLEASLGRFSNTGSLKYLKKDIARIRTMISEKKEVF